MKMKITAKNLIDNGYVKFKPSSIDTWADGYQKAVYDEMTGTKLYFLQIFRHDFSQFDIPHKESWNSSSQFNLNEDETIEVDFFINNSTELERVESFFHDVFYKFDCRPYGD